MSSSQPHLSRREVEDLRSTLDKTIYRCLGYCDSALISAASSCLSNGYDHRKIIDKLSPLLDSKKTPRDKASRLADKILQVASEAHSDSRSSSRKRLADDKDKESRSKEKKSKESQRNGSGDKHAEKDNSDASTVPSLSADRIRHMMLSAQKEIQDRKKALSQLKGDKPEVVTIPATPLSRSSIKTDSLSTIHSITGSKPVFYSQPVTTVFSREDYEKQRRMAELQAKIQSKLLGIGVASTAPGDRPKPLILDKEGRTVDQAGRQVQLAAPAPTLKANIRAQKRSELKATLLGRGGGPGGGQDPEDAAWHDARLAAKPAARKARALKFHEPGKFQQQADRIRMKAQLEKLQNEISQIARKTGISSATKLALLAPDTEDNDDIPEMEWWDNVIIMTAEEKEAAMARGQAAAGGSAEGDQLLGNIKEDAISNLVEHPTQIKPPSEPTKPVYMPVFLTKWERKKLRRQTRREAWKEEQEKVRLGLEAPAQPKLRISNLMRVLGSEAVQDPTKIEAHVREQMAKRRKAHEQANAARKLSDEQRRERRIHKLQEDTSGGVHVGVYRVLDLFEAAAKKFKVEKNAQQLFMTGCVLLHRGCCVVITEGGPKQHAKYKRLMLKRIKWSEDQVKDSEGNQVANACMLVWEGSAPSRSFGELKFKVCPTEKAAREHLAKHRAQHYWDLAYSTAMLNNDDEGI